MSESPEPRKFKRIPIEKRFSGPKFKGEFRRLKEGARSIEKQLWDAFKLPPDSEDVLLEIVSRIRPRLVDLALEARNFAKQYRGFKVGAVALGIRNVDVGENPWVILFDANTKPRKNDPKHCAEQYIMDKIHDPKWQIYRIVSFAVVGVPQTDDESLRTQITLTPCKWCRDRMFEMTTQQPQIISPRTEVYTADARDPRYHKFQTVGTHHELHGEQLEKDIFELD